MFNLNEVGLRMETPTLANGRYRIDRFIGQGGMAGVFLAYDNNLQVERAIKLLHPEFIPNHKVRERFVNEARAMAQIRHPNVVQIFDQGQDGVSLFLVMEYYRMGSLERILSDRKLVIPEALWVLKEVSRGLAEAHGKGYLHRDIKPENMLLSEKGVHLADFGLVQIPNANQTRTKAVMGTLAYMPPEQRISAKRVVAQSDIYALAASFYCMLTQESPDELFEDEERTVKIQSLPVEIQKFLDKGCRAIAVDRFESIQMFQNAIQQLIEQYGEQPLDISLLNEPSEVDKQRLIRLWSQYTSNNTEQEGGIVEDVHTKETLIWEDLAIGSTAVPVEPAPKSPKDPVKNVASTALTSADVLLSIDPSVDLVDTEQPEYIQSFWRQSVRTVNILLIVFAAVLLILMGTIAIIHLSKEEESTNGAGEENRTDVTIEVAKNSEILNSRLESIASPLGKIDYFILDGHLIAMTSEKKEDDRVTHRLFWGPDFSNDTVENWGEQSFDLEDGLTDWTQGKHMFELSIVSVSRDGEKRGFTLWDSRYAAGYQRSISRDEAGQLTLQCEERVYPLQPVDSPPDVKWYQSSMDRRVTVIAKDLQFNYFYMDQLRYNEETPEYRFFKGKKGKMKKIRIIDLSTQNGQFHVLTKKGVFKINAEDGSWIRNPVEKSVSVPLENMSVAQNAKFIYTELGVYSTKLLGTPCDIQWMDSE